MKKISVLKEIRDGLGLHLERNGVTNYIVGYHVLSAFTDLSSSETTTSSGIFTDDIDSSIYVINVAAKEISRFIKMSL